MILDATCGAKTMYRGLHHGFDSSEIIYMDERCGDFKQKGDEKKIVRIKPNIVARIERLPFRDGAFNLLIFDPPHGTFTLDCYMWAQYGGLTQRQYIHLIAQANREFARVVTAGGVVVAKVIDAMERDYIARSGLSDFRVLLDLEHRSKSYMPRTHSTTHYLIMVKKPVSSRPRVAGSGIPNRQAPLPSG